MKYDITKLRNIGISAHIDSGKTTLTERILFYTNKIRKMHEVRGKDGVGATMDFMELERERGITISSASTRVTWKEHDINIIDTPGHIDFTIQVENALRVLDGAILVLCAVGGVQSQTITVNTQMKRYQVPCIAFINKMDRIGANPYKVTDQLKDKLGFNAVLTQIPIGLGDDFEGYIDLLEMKAYYFDENQRSPRKYDTKFPTYLIQEAETRREELINQAALYSDKLTEAYLKGDVTSKILREAIRKGVLERNLTPVFIGSAYKNKGILHLIDAIIDYLPAPNDKDNYAFDLDHQDKKIILHSDPKKETVAMAFKLDNQVYGQLTYLRIYQGTIKKGMELHIVSSQKKIKVGRLIRMHANSMEDIIEAFAGDIIALYGVDCTLGDTFVSGDINLSLQSGFVPEPIISLSIKPKDKKSEDNAAKALNKFQKEDATFKAYIEDETKETIIKGMGELHLEVYIERMKREFNIELDIGKPQVVYRETITAPSKFNYTYRKQTGGRGQYARICGFITPSGSDENIFINEIKGGAIPSNFIPYIEKGFHEALAKGKLTSFPIIGTQMTINDGNHHPVDSQTISFEMATILAFKECYLTAKPRILEPIMKLEITTPTEFQGTIIGSINQRRGQITETIVETYLTKIEANIPLSEVFGYATILRSLTSGKADFSMEFLKYDLLPKNLEITQKL